LVLILGSIIYRCTFCAVLIIITANLRNRIHQKKGMIAEEKNKLFSFLNTHFEMIYVLSLKRSHNRHEMIKNSLNGLDFDFFWGVDGKNLDIKEMVNKGVYQPSLTKLFQKRRGENVRNLSLSQIACALSHSHILQDVVKNGYNNALIFEDDILIEGGEVEELEDAFFELPDNWDLLYLGHHGANSNPSLLLRIQIFILHLLAKPLQHFERLRMFDPEVINRWIPHTYSKHLNESGSHHGAFAYAVSNKGAEKILGYRWPIVVRNDNLLAELCSNGRLNAYNTKNVVFYPNRQIPSTINDCDYETNYKLEDRSELAITTKLQ
jgi:glycosyl transferase, family 25